MCIYYFNFLDYTCKGLFHSSFAWDQEFSILLHCVLLHLHGSVFICECGPRGPETKPADQNTHWTIWGVGGACGGTKEKIFQMLFCYLILEELGFQEIHFKLVLTNFVSFQNIHLFTSISCFKNEPSCFEWQEY